MGKLPSADRKLWMGQFCLKEKEQVRSNCMYLKRQWQWQWSSATLYFTVISTFSHCNNSNKTEIKLCILNNWTLCSEVFILVYLQSKTLKMIHSSGSKRDFFTNTFLKYPFDFWDKTMCKSSEVSFKMWNNQDNNDDKFFFEDLLVTN